MSVLAHHNFTSAKVATVLLSSAFLRQLKHAASSRATAIHTGGSVGPGLAASLHLASAHRAAMVLERVVASTRVQDLLFVEPLKLVNGALRAPTLPGLGVELREEVMRGHPYQPGSGERT